MPRYINQKLLSVGVTKLKGIENLEALSLSPNAVTAILGANCIGKSSLLHALASSYQPEDGEHSENHRMSEYLKPNPHALWNGTEFKVEYEFEDRANQDGLQQEIKVYSKNSDRWKPRYDRRPYRSVFYIGIHTTLPVLEYINFIKNKSAIGSQRIRYNTVEQNSDFFLQIKAKASYIFNRNYTNIYTHEIQGWSDSLFGLACESMTYSQISMGAGEQRVLKILATVFKAKDNTLILIDELDLLLHEDAFQRAIEVICDRARQKHLQVIFTTHRETVLKKSDTINIRYLYKTGNTTKVLEQVTPDALAQLTGSLDKSIIIYVEDNLSTRIIKKISQSVGVSRHIKTVQFGSAKNGFAVSAGAVMTNPDKHVVCVLDGDVYRTEQEKIEQINKIVTGNSAESASHRASVLGVIFQYSIPAGVSPEQYLKESIVSMSRNDIPAHFVEIYDALSNIRAVLDRHNYIDSIMQFYDESPEVIIKDVVELFSTTPQWVDFSLRVREILEQKSVLLRLNENSQAQPPQPLVVAGIVS